MKVEKFRFFRHDVLENADGMFQVNNSLLCRGFVTFSVDDDGYVVEDDFDILGAVHEKWVDRDVEIEIWNGGDTSPIIEIEEANTGCPIGKLVPESEICQPL